MVFKKLKNRKGETLVESLLSILIIVVAVLALTTSIVTAAKINRSAEDIKTTVNYSGTSVSIDVYCNGRSVSGINGYEEGGLYYYEY